ncbi:MAG: ABC transporter substrate-binding protein [bacterium]|nr:MAG: ABC transporter substrate-binding protein [bacterium]KAF0147532.1 MAG: ABC transporter substrate-binding protein [bacterium]KAF0166019.1 MAG: ABC transporter substrate-binding protein [bacterium]TXT16610.1 MAG: ABC transporter substrate-binding protein [bacterium]
MAIPPSYSPRRGGLFAAWIAACLLLAWMTGALAAPAVTLVLSEDAPLYAAVARALRAELEADRRGWQLRVRTWREYRSAEEHADLVVPVGLRALQSVLAERDNTPVWALLVPRASFEQLAGKASARGRPVSALYLDQPLSRHMRMLKAALPRARQVGVLLGPESSVRPEALRAAAESSQLKIVSARVDAIEDLVPALTSLRNEIDALLLVPDPLVVGRGGLHALLLHTYQLTLPVAAYSAQLLEAGATLALFATPEQIGAEAGARLREARGGNGVVVPAPEHPQSYQVAVNRNVAVSLELRIPAGETLRLRMERGTEP